MAKRGAGTWARKRGGQEQGKSETARARGLEERGTCVRLAGREAGPRREAMQHNAIPGDDGDGNVKRGWVKSKVRGTCEGFKNFEGVEQSEEVGKFVAASLSF